MERKDRWFIAAGVGLALSLAALVSPFASSAPDGLEKVAEEKGFARKADAPVWKQAPMPDYSAAAVGNGPTLPGLVGTAAAFLAVLAVARLIARKRTGNDRHADAGASRLRRKRGPPP